MSDSPNINGIILTGGKSRRMGSNKALLVYKGQSFLEHIVDALKPICKEIFLIGRSKEYDEFGLTQLEDLEEQTGPISAICSGLQHSNAEYNLVLSCDVPMVSSSLLKTLTDKATGYDVTLFTDGKHSTPLIACYRKPCIPVFKHLLKNKRYRLMDAIEALKCNIIPLMEHEKPLIKNINTPEDLKQLIYEN